MESNCGKALQLKSLISVGGSSGASSGWTANHGRVNFEHGIPAVRKICRRGENAGLGFYGCPMWKSKHLDCGFFKWEKYLVGEVENGIVQGLVEQNKMLKERIEQLMCEIGTVAQLKEENLGLKKKLTKEKEKRMKAREEIVMLKKKAFNRSAMEVLGLVFEILLAVPVSKRM